MARLPGATPRLAGTTVRLPGALARLHGMVARLGILAALAALAAVHGCGVEGRAAEDAGASGIEGDRPVALVTGSTSGLGREVALALGRTGAHVIVHGRDEERGAEVVALIRDEGSGTASFHRADFASLEEVGGLAEAVLREHDRLDYLVNNAGIWLDGPEERRLSEDGHELHFQVNYLAGFLLTRRLLPLLVETAPSRIVNVSSAAQRPLDFDDPLLEDGYGHSRAYSQSKLAQVLFTVDLAQEVEGTGVVVAALHPATFMDTNMVISRGAEPRASVEEGRDAVMHVLTSPDVESGQYFNGTRPADPNPQAHDPEARAQLRALSLELVGGDGG